MHFSAGQVTKQLTIYIATCIYLVVLGGLFHAQVSMGSVAAISGVANIFGLLLWPGCEGVQKAMCERRSSSNLTGVVPHRRPFLQCFTVFSVGGSGWGGIWMPTDDFKNGLRTACFKSKARSVPLPPRMYVDGKTIIREVNDMQALRKGDHCLVGMKTVRCLSPYVDRLFSWLCSYELHNLYHHFMLVDDVATVDSQGIPRTTTGSMVRVLEYTSTIPESLEMVCASNKGGGCLQVPGACVRMLLDKGQCKLVPMVEYGDMPNIFIVMEESPTMEERDRMVENAHKLAEHNEPYHMLLNNCEHCIFQARKGQHLSLEVHLVVRCCLFFFARCLGVLCLVLAIEQKAPLSAYHVLAAGSICVHAMQLFWKIAQSVQQQLASNIVDYPDACHLIVKELARLITGLAVALTCMSAGMNAAATGQGLQFACTLTLFGPFGADMVFNFLVSSAVRLFLLPIFGRVWFSKQV